MNVISFLQSLDPNVIALGITIVSTFGGWLWHKLRGDSQASLASTAEALARQAIHELLSDPNVTAASTAYVRATIETAIDAGLKRLGAIGALAMPLIHPVIERAIADALDMLRVRDQSAAQAASLPQRWDDLFGNLVPRVAVAMKQAADEGLAKGRAILSDADVTPGPAAPELELAPAAPAGA